MPWSDLKMETTRDKLCNQSTSPDVPVTITPFFSAGGRSASSRSLFTPACHNKLQCYLVTLHHFFSKYVTSYTNSAVSSIEHATYLQRPPKTCSHPQIPHSWRQIETHIPPDTWSELEVLWWSWHAFMIQVGSCFVLNLLYTTYV